MAGQAADVTTFSAAAAVHKDNRLMATCLHTGRKDAVSADPADRLPAETLSAEALRLNFEAKGLSAQELIALSGAHTVCHL